MATRFMLTSPIERLRQIYGVDGGVPYPPRPNIRPTEPIVVVRLKPGIEASGQRELALVRWGLIPHWVKDPREFATLLTARAETVLEKPSFKIPMRHRRCIIPADGWYEWTGKSRHKVAHLVRLADEAARPMAFAGLWDYWLGRDGSEIDTAAIVTVATPPGSAYAHERMPVLLPPEAAKAWLDVRGTDQEQAAHLLQPWTTSALDVSTVTSRLDDPERDEPELM
jgi:putative SOS response-associated peptidase YedK